MTIPSRTVSSLPSGTAFSRYAQALGRARGDLLAAVDIAKEWRDLPHVAASFENSFNKAAVGAGSTTEWGSGLATDSFGIATEAITLHDAMMVLGMVSSRLRRLAFKIAYPRQIGGGTGGGRVGEGVASPVVAYAFDTIVMAPAKFQTISVVSRELLKVGRAAETSLRAAILNALALAIDLAFLSPGATGSITNGATAVTSTGGSAPTAAQLIADLSALLAAVTTTASTPIWILRPLTAARISLVLGAAASDLPRTLLGLPVVLSTNSPQQIALVDPGEIGYADDGVFDLSIAESATVEMSDAPSNAGASSSSPADPVATSVVSLWQTNAVGFRATRWLNFERLRAGSVAYMLTAY